MFENKTEDVFENFRNDKEIFDFSNHSTKSKNIMIIMIMTLIMKLTRFLCIALSVDSINITWRYLYNKGKNTFVIL